uniref:Nucleolar complex-associated protein 3 N-terminal domain-containing protein n=1 Tax=Oryza punctata TaxID=4537 RepID=A0A0E0KF39_ORYPU
MEMMMMRRIARTKRHLGMVLPHYLPCTRPPSGLAVVGLRQMVLLHARRRKKNKVILPPQLPPAVDNDEDFFRGNEGHSRALAGFDRKSIDRYVTRVANHDEDKVERLYEERERRRKAAEALSLRASKEHDDLVEVDRVNALPVKTLQGEMVYNNGKEDLSAEELFEKRKAQLAEIGMSMLENPEWNIRSLKDLLSICNDEDQKVVKPGLMSLLAVFRDIIPSYWIRQLTEKQLAVEVSKDVKKMRYYEYTPRTYKVAQGRPSILR